MVAAPLVASEAEPHDVSPRPETRVSFNGSSKEGINTQSNWGRILCHLKREISAQHADIPIIACCLVSGLCDSSAYNAWTCFVSMQTGT